MKFFSLVALFLFSLNCWAWTYSYNANEKYNGLDLYDIGSQLKANSFLELDLTRAGRVPFVSIDQMFVNTQSLDSFAVVIFDLVTSEKVKTFEVGTNSLVCHATTQAGRPFAVYFSDKRQSRNISYCQTKTSANFHHFLMKQILPSAQAADCYAVTQIRKSAEQTRNLVSADQNWLLQKLGTCLVSALRGGTETAQGFGDGVKDLLLALKNPAQMWEHISEQAKAFKNFVTNIGSEVQMMVQNFKNLDPDLLLNMACKASGEILVGSLLTGGVLGLTAKIGTAIFKLAGQLKSLSSALTRISELKAKGHLDLANGILSCGT